MRALLEQTEDQKQRAYLINHFLDQFKGTIYRQTMFAEFEREMGRLSWQGETLTAELLQSVGAQEKELIEPERETVDVRLLLADLREYSGVEKLTPEVVNKIIKRIEVHKSEVADGHKQVKIDIYFTGAGPVDLATVKEMLAIAEAAQNTAPTSHF